MHRRNALLAIALFAGAACSPGSGQDAADGANTAVAEGIPLTVYLTPT